MLFLSAGLWVLAALASAKPLTEESSTSISLDRSPGLIEAGEVVLNVLRTDDLLSDYTPQHERSHILSRLTHVVVRVQLDAESSTLAINDEKLDLQSLVPNQAGQAPKVQVVKASAYRVSQHAGRKHLSSEDLEKFADLAMPQGIVSVELSIEEDASESAPVAVPDTDLAQDAAITMRAYKLFLKITEIEQQQLSHSTTVLVPILKVHLSYAGGSAEPVSLKAFAIRPKKTPHHYGEEMGEGPRPDGPRHRPSHGGERRPTFDESPRHRRPHPSEEELGNTRFELDSTETEWMHGYHHSEISDDSDDESRGFHREPSHRRPEPAFEEDRIDIMGESIHRGPPRAPAVEEEEFRHLFEHGEGRPRHRSGHGGQHHRGPPAFVTWLADLLGLAPPAHHMHMHHPRPSPFRHHRESGSESFEELDVDSSMPPPPPPHHPPSHSSHHHRYHRHGHVHSPLAFAALFFLAMCTKLAVVGTVAFVAVRKARSFLQARRDARQGSVRLESDSPVVSEKALPPYESLAEVVVVPSDKA